MNTTPEVALIVAALALIGVLVNALIAAGNARKRGDIDKRLLVLKAEYDSLNALELASVQASHSQQLQELEHTHVRSMAEIQESQSRRLQELQHKHDVELKRLEVRMQEQISAERMREIMNEANWKRVHEQIRKLKAVGLDMLGVFAAIAQRGHEADDEEMFPNVAVALKLHTEFKELLREVRAEIRDDDYRRLGALHKYLIEVFLDLARTKKERVERVAVMAGHAERIRSEERYIETMAAHFLQPRLQSK